MYHLCPWLSVCLIANQLSAQLCKWLISRLTDWFNFRTDHSAVEMTNQMCDCWIDHWTGMDQLCGRLKSRANVQLLWLFHHFFRLFPQRHLPSVVVGRWSFSTAAEAAAWRQQTYLFQNVSRCPLCNKHKIQHTGQGSEQILKCWALPLTHTFIFHTDKCCPTGCYSNGVTCRTVDHLWSSPAASLCSHSLQQDGFNNFYMTWHSCCSQQKALVTDTKMKVCNVSYQAIQDM